MNRPLILLSLVVLLSLSLAVRAADPQPEAPPQVSPQPTLPLSEVVLYSSGVGYFQRDGSIDGHGHMELRFKVDNINVLLKSILVQDFDGGRAAAVPHDSRDPTTKTLKRFAMVL